MLAAKIKRRRKVLKNDTMIASCLGDTSAMGAASMGGQSMETLQAF